MAPTTAASRGKNSGKKTEKVSTGSRSAPPGTETPAQASALPPKATQSPNLEPWMRQTVVLKLREVEGKAPDMSTDVFGKKMVMEQGFSKAETVSIQTFIGGLFYITFASMAICRRYWERVKAAGPESPFTRFVGNSPIQREERRVTVAMRNPHTPVKDIITFLTRFCTVIRDPIQITDSNGFWTGKYSVLVKLQREESSADGLKHLPQSFSLGSSPGLIYYPDQPQTCRKCGQLGHQAKTCTANACRICKVLGHEAKDCPRSKACNLCGLASHVYRDCPQRSRTYASVAQAKPTPSAPANNRATPAAPAKTHNKGKTPAPAKVTPPAPAKTKNNEKKGKPPTAAPAPSPTPAPTFTPPSPLAAPLTSPPGAAGFSLEDFPPLTHPSHPLPSSPALCKKRTREAEDSPTAEQQEKKMAVADPGDTSSSEEDEGKVVEQATEDMELLLEELGQIPVKPEDVNRVLQLEEALLLQLESPEESPPPPDNAGGDPPDQSELFAECIRRNPEIRGITAPGPARSQIKCSLYMDDVTVFCADQPSVRALVQTCEDFSKASGAKVNCGKSETLLFGDWNLASDNVPFSIKADFIKILGVWFGGEGAALKCWEERMAKVRQKIGLWSLRDLTIEGKTLVLRNEILPVLQYMAQAWPPLATVCRAITRAVFHFIWGSKMDRVKRSVMYKAPCKGGKGVPDIPTLLRSFFVCNCIRQTITGKEKDSVGSSMSRFFLLPLWRSLGWDKWDSSYPYNWNTPWFYLDVTKFVREHQLEGVKPDLWKPKTIHKLIRAKDKMESIPGLPEDTAKVVWGNVSSDSLTNKHKDMSWMAIQGGLPLRTFMHARNLCRYRHCPRCILYEETSLHTFWDCQFAQVLLDALEHELKDCVPRNLLTHHAVLYGLFQGTHTEGAIQEAWRLMNSFKDVLWYSRNCLILRRERMTIQDCRRLIHSLLRDYNIRDSLEEEED
eukprot:XP_012824861.1 PREDICTED: uncharacterized protein LOC105948215 isoform X1 [Xenopus tropicalis]